MLSLTLVSLVLAAATAATELFDRNLVYSSPFNGHPQFARDTRAIQKRQVRYVKRQLQNATGDVDEAYPTYYGSDFSNSPYIWSGGIEFTHRVASGDPWHDSVLLWTRAVPVSALPSVDIPVCVSFAIFDKDDLSGKPLDSGKGFTTYEVDFTVKFEAKNLKPDTKYWYRFADCTNATTVSPVGATRTIAHPDTPAHQVNGGKPLSLAVFSCAQYQTGWFNAYGVAVHNTSADIFVHLGDYIYEDVGNGSAIGRAVLGRELATLADYRQRLNQYRSDPHLLDAHQTAPWILVWDDHEVADNTWKAGTADSNDTALGCAFSPAGVCFSDRKFAAVRAYHEWIPIRQVNVDDKLRIWRNFEIGKLLDLTMLDTRLYDRDITDLYYNTNVSSLADFANRTLMGSEQEAWFYNTLTNSQKRGATWRVIGQQIVFTQLHLVTAFNFDAWDGYRANRNRVLNHIHDNKLDNIVMLSGDSHANWVSDLAYPNDTTTYDSSTGQGSMGVEFAGTAVTSASPFGQNITPQASQLVEGFIIGDKLNTDLQWAEGSYRGFFLLTVSPSTVNATYWAMKDLTSLNLNAFPSVQFTVHSGANKLARPVGGGKALAGTLKA